MVKFEENLPQNYKYAFCLVNNIPIISYDKIDENISIGKNACASMTESNISNLFIYLIRYSKKSLLKIFDYIYFRKNKF